MPGGPGFYFYFAITLGNLGGRRSLADVSTAVRRHFGRRVALSLEYS
jgi:hypothetical protein